MVPITIVTGAYKPTYNWGGGHIVVLGPSDYFDRTYHVGPSNINIAELIVVL